MRTMFKVGMLALALAAMPIAAQAGPLEGAAVGLGTGALVAGPPGALVGAVIGAVVGGPDVVDGPYVVESERRRHCWINHNGYRRCGWR